MRRRYWFPQKRYGYGAGLPYDWRGWTLLASYIAGVNLLLLPAAFVAPSLMAPALAVFVLLTIAFVIVVARKTEGGFVWRWDR